jgi:hypothetical protein
MVSFCTAVSGVVMGQTIQLLHIACLRMNSDAMASKIFLLHGTRILGKRTGFEVSFPVIKGVVDVAFTINKISYIMMYTCMLMTHEASSFPNQPKKPAHATDIEWCGGGIENPAMWQFNK